MPRSSSGIASPADFCAWRREEKLSSTVPAEMVLRYQISRRVSTPSLNQSDIAVLRAQMTDDLKATWDSRATARHFPEAIVTTTTTTTICLSSCSCWVVRVTFTVICPPCFCCVSPLTIFRATMSNHPALSASVDVSQSLSIFLAEYSRKVLIYCSCATITLTS